MNDNNRSDYTDKEISNYLYLINQIEKSKYYRVLKLLTIFRPYHKLHSSDSETSSERLAHLESYYNQLTSAKLFAAWQNFNEVKKLLKSIKKKPDLVKKYLLILLKIGPVGFIRKVNSIFQNKHFYISLKKDYAKWVSINYPTEKVLEIQRKNSKSFKHRPLISIIVPTYNTNPVFLRECLDSVLAQSYENWELCIADDKSPNKDVIEILKEYSYKDTRIKYIVRKQNGHICEASNSALELAKGEYVSLLDHDDILWPNALYEIVYKINKIPTAGLIYSDEDKLEEYTNIHTDPFFKPDFNFDYLRSINYITHFSTFKKNIVDHLGGFRKGYEGSQDWDLILRATNYIQNSTDYTIEHISTVIYSWRKSETSTASERYSDTVKSYAYVSQRNTLKDDLRERNVKGEVVETKYLGSWRVKYHLTANPLVSIIIPNKNSYTLLKECVDSILTITKYKNFECIIVDNDSDDTQVLNYYSKLKKQGVTVLTFAEEFNFSKMCNLGSENSQGEHLVFLNNDTEIYDPEWLENLLEHSQRADVGIVGGKLLYPNHTIQSMGIVLVENDYKNDVYVAIHPGKGINDEAVQGFPAIHYKDSVREVTAVTAACCMIKKSVFEMVNGFDESLPVAFNDVDICMRIKENGYRNIYTPYSTIIHHESHSLGDVDSKRRDNKRFMKDVDVFTDKWKSKDVVDMFLNPNITRNKENFSLKL